MRLFRAFRVSVAKKQTANSEHKKTKGPLGHRPWRKIINQVHLFRAFRVSVAKKQTANPENTKNKKVCGDTDLGLEYLLKNNDCLLNNQVGSQCEQKYSDGFIDN
ncbi:hypothetical protein SRABI27_01073 [Pedobacter sp. Bi27]|nr:hypothetical protein SRABI27_01073 [Pedobacter sp. Bi27]